jgi:hypothetical protein
MLVWAALSFLPDADVIGFGFGIRYQAPGVIAAPRTRWRLRWRSASHSDSWRARPSLRVRTGVMATLVLASHSLLDTFTRRWARLRTHLAVRRHAVLRAVAAVAGVADRARLSVAVRHVCRGPRSSCVRAGSRYAFQVATCPRRLKPPLYVERGLAIRCASVPSDLWFKRSSKGLDNQTTWH